MKKPTVLAAALSAVLCASAAHNYVTLKSSLSDKTINWESGESYEGGKAPGADDTILIPNNMTAKVDDDSVAFVGSRYRIQPAGRKSILEINVSTNSVWAAPFTSYSPDASSGFNRNYGLLVKQGAGDLNIQLVGGFSGNSKNYEYLSSFVVSNGVLRMPTVPDDAASTNLYMKSVYVESPGVFFSPGGKKICYFVNEVWGDGMVTNVPGSAEFSIDGSDGVPSVFEGQFCTSSRLTLRYKADFGLSGYENTFPSVYLYEASMLGLVSFNGTKGSPSPSGIADNITTAGNSGIRYLGSSGIGDGSKYIYNYSGTNVVDAGEGGVDIITRPIYIMESGASVRPFLFTGSNEIAAVCSADLPDRVVGEGGQAAPGIYPPYVIKSGSGTWDFSSTSRKWSGGLAVEEGTLRFSSLSHTGVSGPLGVATNLYEEYCGAPDPERKVNYAIRLGDVRGDKLTEGTLELDKKGASVDATNRLVVLKGDGQLLNSGANGFRIRGVSALTSGLKTLALNSASEQSENILEDVTDGAGKVGIVKRGRGSWKIERSQAITGPIEVDAGELILNQRATYFRVAFTENVATTNNWDNSWRNKVLLHELALYDADGNRVNTGITKVTTSTLQPNQARFYQGSDVNLDSKNPYGLNALFDDSTTTDHGWAGGAAKGGFITTDDESMWPIFEFRLPDTVAEVCSYDIIHAAPAAIYYYCAPRGWKIWGSYDGKDWFEVASTNNAAVNYSWVGKWYSDKSTFVAGAKRTGFPINTRYNGGSSAANCSYLRVKSDAKLTVYGTCTVNGLKIDAEDVGTVEGVTFAAAGFVDIENMPSDNPDFELPGTYTRVTGMENLVNWQLMAGGESLSSRKLKYVNGKIRVVAPGLYITIR